jgi:hypothetical protein
MIILYDSFEEIKLIPSYLFKHSKITIRPSDEFYKELMGWK